MSDTTFHIVTEHGQYNLPAALMQIKFPGVYSEALDRHYSGDYSLTLAGRRVKLDSGETVLEVYWD